MLRRFKVNDGNIKEAFSCVLEFIHERLTELKIDTIEANYAELMSEESLTRLIEYGDFSRNDAIRVNIRKLFGDVKIELTVPGREFNFSESFESIVPFQSADYNEEDSPHTTEAVRNIILHSFTDRISYRHTGNFNTIRVYALHSPYYGLYQTLAAVVLAVITGLTLNIAAPDITQTINDNILSAVHDIFMSGLNMCSVPIVFFSIASCIANFGSMSGMRKTGTLLMIAFMISGLLSAFVGFGVLMPFRPGAELSRYLLSSSNVAETASGVSGVSFRDVLTGLMPSNIIQPLLNGNMLQIIIIAVLVGISAGRVSAKNFRTFIEESNNVFMDVMGMIAYMIPLIVFCSITSMIITTGLSVILSILGILCIMLASYIVLFVVQCLSVLVISRLNPLVMLRKSMPMIITAFTTSSSTAAIPDSMNSCDNLGISQKLYSLSIPLGTAINKNGFCIFLAGYVMLAANIYGISMPFSKMITLALTIVALVTASPGVPGAGLAVITTLFTQIGSPLEIITLTMAISPILDMFDTVTTCMGNLVSTIIAAKHENMLDPEKYNSNE